MASVFDYLQWRGDIPLQLDPFNEVDSLILSLTAYTDFQGIVGENAERIPLSSAAGAFFSSHSRETVRQDKSCTVRAALLMDGMLSGARFAGTTLSHYVNAVDAGKNMQMAAVVFHLEDGSAYIAFRGTDSSLVGWRENFEFGMPEDTEGEKSAVDYLNAAADDIPGPLIVGGHSKGGHLAVFASAFCRREVLSRIIAVYSNDGPGFRSEIVSSPEYAAILPRVKSILPDTSVFGRLLESRSEPKVVKSSTSGIYQHDGLTWQVRRNRFEETQPTAAGSLIDGTLSGWIDQMDDATRASFTDTVFSLAESTGEKTIRAMGDQKLKSAEAIIGKLIQMPREKQQEALDIAKRLGRSGGQAAVRVLSDLLAGIRGNDKNTDE